MTHPKEGVWVRVIQFGALIAGYGTLGLSLMIAIEVLGRKFFNFSFQGVDEIGGYVLAIGVSFSLAYAFVMRAHTRVDVFINLLKPTPKVIFNLLAALMLAGFALFLAWQSFESLMETIEFDSRASTPLQTPLWIPQTIWVVGFALFALTTLWYALYGLYLVVNRRVTEANHLLGPRTADDELAEALEELGEQSLAPITPHKEARHD